MADSGVRRVAGDRRARALVSAVPCTKEAPQHEPIGRMSMNRIATLACILLLAPSLARAAAIVGSSAPPLELRDADGKTVRLDAYKGKFVVLEWVNRQCPFVRKHYGSGNMQSLQKKY